jgi:alkanesulfonate monooxygenase SsuD/methylene tetrahydromethanopterin reductase-like flavin-dependent oxidoreductase (luciferase family)
MRLSVLDQSTASQGKPQDVAIRDTLALAKHCDALGYHRYWVSEHHNSGNIVGTAPEILMSAIAATTPRIRVGSAGVMLPHYSAFKVAEQFRVLEAIAPGRIDLGLGRAPGSDRLTSYALNPHPEDVNDQFPRQIQELQCWVSGAPLPEGHPLGAYLGMPYAFAYFFSYGFDVDQALALYRKNYRPSEQHPKPQCTICVWALAADTEAEALYQFKSRERAMLEREVGVRRPLMSPAEAAAHELTPREQAFSENLRRQAVVGSIDQVKTKLDALAKRLDLDELVVVTWTYDLAPRMRSYELLAQAYDLQVV